MMHRRYILMGFVLSFLCGSSPLWAVQTPVFTILSDSVSGDKINGWGDVALYGAATSPTPPEGYYSMQMGSPAGGGGWGVYYLQPGGLDLSNYATSGELRFWANCSTDNFALVILHTDSSSENYDFANVFGGAFNVWVPVAVPLNQIRYPINDIYSPFIINLNVPGTCYFDNVRVVNPPAPNAELFHVAVNNISDQKPVTNLTWSPVTPQSGWVRSNQYLQLDTDVETLGWGVQIYTNNTAAGASPQFRTTVQSGQIGSNPAGLVNTQATSQTIPMAWSIKAGTQTALAAAPPAAEPNNNGQNGHTTDPNAFQWLYMEDAATPAIPANGTSAFSNGDPFITVKNNYGNHYAQGPETIPYVPTQFGAQDSPNYIYLEANFGLAVAQTYQTSTITVEFYYQ